MSKKNNKQKYKKYADFIKEEQIKAEEERKKKQDKKVENREKNEVFNELQTLALNNEKDVKMTVNESKKKPKKKARKHKLH